MIVYNTYISIYNIYLQYEIYIKNIETCQYNQTNQPIEKHFIYSLTIKEYDRNNPKLSTLQGVIVNTLLHAKWVGIDYILNETTIAIIYKLYRSYVWK